MKKFLKVIIPFLLSIFIVGCSQGASTQTATYIKEETGIKSELVYTYKDDKVLKQTSVNTISLKELGVTKERIKELMDPLSKQYNEITGLEHKVEYSDDTVIETTTVDYEKLDFAKAKSSGLPGINLSGNTDNGISMKGSEEMVLNQGYKKK